MKSPVFLFCLFVITMASVMNPMVPTVRAGNSQFSDILTFPVILPPTSPGSIINAFAMITLNITKDSTATVTAATGNIGIIFSGVSGMDSISRLNIREGLNGPLIKFGPGGDFSGPGSFAPEPFTLGCFNVVADVAQRIINNPSSFYLEVLFLSPFVLIRGKLGSRPQITSVVRRGKTLVVFGENFRPGAEILMDFEVQETQNDDSSPSTILISKGAGKKIAHGSTVIIQVRDPSGLTGDQVKFTRD